MGLTARLKCYIRTSWQSVRGGHQEEGLLGGVPLLWNNSLPRGGDACLGLSAAALRLLVNNTKLSLELPCQGCFDVVWFSLWFRGFVNFLNVNCFKSC